MTYYRFVGTTQTKNHWGYCRAVSRDAAKTVAQQKIEEHGEILKLSLRSLPFRPWLVRQVIRSESFLRRVFGWTMERYS